MKRKGFLLGAGASYDFGMPLVWDLTRQLKGWLTPEKLKSLNDNWISKGGGHKKETIEIIQNILRQSNFHYEQIIGALEVEAYRNLRNHALYHDLWGMIDWLLDLVYYLLYRRQIHSFSSLKITLELYSRLRDFVIRDYPFWIFNLNHDINIELLAKHYDIPLKTGFSQFEFDKNLGCFSDRDSSHVFPLRNQKCEITGEIKFEALHVKDLKSTPLNYYNNSNDTGCINLFKLHGSLDSFLFDDRKVYLKILPNKNGFEGLLQNLIDVNSKMLYAQAFNPIDQFYTNTGTTNEICFADHTGEMQFLRRDLLSGMHKFSSRVSNSSKVPVELLEAFKQHINFVSELYVVGYNFGDSHINQILRDWISFNAERKIIAVNPAMVGVPEEFKIYINQFEIRGTTFLQFLCDEMKKPLSAKEDFIIKGRNLVRNFVKNK